MSASESDDEYAPRQPFFPRYLFPSEDCALDGIALRAQLLGLTTGLTISASIYLFLQDSIYHLTCFLLCLSIFHFLEYYVTARYNTQRATISAFLFSNGKAYNIAHATAAAEYLLEYLFVPSLRYPKPYVFFVGLGFIIAGQTLRSLAMIHAATNFNHQVAYRKEYGHTLVTTGVYAYIRHPSYLGFWLWGLGTQLMMGNPVSFVGYAAVLWKFFSRRIGYEEEYLIRFFGKEYRNYRERTKTWIPFIP